jgi:hypothetical protein
LVTEGKKEKKKKGKNLKSYKTKEHYKTGLITPPPSLKQAKRKLLKT